MPQDINNDKETKDQTNFNNNIQVKNVTLSVM